MGVFGLDVKRGVWNENGGNRIFWAGFMWLVGGQDVGLQFLFSFGWCYVSDSL